MAINIDDTTRRKAIKILENEQTELDGAYTKQAVKGSPGMEAEFLPETASLAQGRTEKRIVKDSKGRYTEEDRFIEQKFFDESVVDKKESQFKEDAETLQEVCRAYDKEIIRLNNQINAKKQIIVDLSEAAIAGGCTTRHSSFVGLGTTAATINEEVEFVKIYPKMAGPGYDPGTDNPFEPDAIVHLNSAYAGFGYKNVREKQEILVGSGATTGIRTDGSGSGIGSAFFIGTLSDGYTHSLFGTYSSQDCHSTGEQQQTLYNEILVLRKERDSYRNKLNIIKKNKSDKELSHWGYQNTKNEVNVRKNKNAAAIAAINELDGANTIQEPGLVLYFDAANNSSYYGSGNTWYDISNDDYDDNGTINGGTFIEDPTDSQRNYFRFSGGSGANNTGTQSVSFDITDTVFGDPDTVTVEMLAQITADSSFDLQTYGGVMFGWSAYEIWLKTPEVSDPLPGLGFNISGGVLVGITPERVDALLLNNESSERQYDVFPAQWAHYTFVMHKYQVGAGTTLSQLLNNKIYINGVSESIEELRPSATYDSGYMNFNNGAGKICGRVIDDNYNLPQEVALFRVYNKELTQAEITANYDEVRGRFSLV